MKHLVVLAGFLLSVALVRAQAGSSPVQTGSSMGQAGSSMGQAGPTSSLDSSPLDLSYYPIDYPVLKIQDKVNEPLIARVVYSRPLKKGRRLFGELVAYGQVWRLGANEATEIEFFKDVKIDGKTLKKGRYTLYALVNADNWTVIFNKETDTWGAFRYTATKDILRATVPVEKQSDVTEVFSIAFQKAEKGVGKTEKGANLVFKWDDILVKLPISW